MNVIYTRWVPRIKTKAGSVKTVEVPLARTGSGFTLLFEAFSMLLIESEMPINKVSEVMRVVANRIWRVFNHWVTKAVKKDDLSQVKEVVIDETSSKKGQNYVTVCADIEQRRVIFVAEGKGQETIKEFADALKEKGGSAEKIEQVGIDMSPAFISGVTKYLPQAKITFDKFHTVAMLNKAMDDLRKAERKEHQLLKGHKYTVLKHYAKLKNKEKDELDMILLAYPRLGEAYRLKELFVDFWDIREKEEALGFLTFWCDMVMETDIQPFKKFVSTLKAHWSGIVNFIDSRINSGILEGINNKIQLAKRMARGYRNMTNFTNMIYFIAGKLQFDYPHYPL